MRGHLSTDELAHLELVTGRMVRAKMPHFNLVERPLEERRELKRTIDELRLAVGEREPRVMEAEARQVVVDDSLACEGFG